MHSEALENPIQFQNASEVQEYLDCHPITAWLLFERGFQNSLVLKTLLKPELSKLPNPFTLKDMDVAVARVLNAVNGKEKIVVYGDYDVDGTCGSALLTDFFSQIGFPIEVYQPNRFKEGYGINSDAIRKITANGAKVIISVDCGITAHEPALVCKELGVDLIVLDHHKCHPELPQAFAVVNPQRPDDASKLNNVCGTTIAFFFAMALRSKLRESGFFSHTLQEPNLKSFLDLVAVATVADVMDVRGVNRILLTHGLKVLNESPRIGLKAIIDKAGIKKVTSMHCGFILGPRINAAGRLEHAKAALNLLTCQDEESASRLADDLEEINQSRRIVQDSVVVEAVKQAEEFVASFRSPEANEIAQTTGPWPRAIVLYNPEWHEGVLGIVASKIVEKFKRPTIILSQKEKLSTKENPDSDVKIIKGSVRSFSKIDIMAQISSEFVAQTLQNFGGHAHAGGISLAFDQLTEFTTRLNQHMAQTTSHADYDKAMKYDLEVQMNQINAKLMSELALLEPFGHQFPEPVFKFTNLLPQTVKILKEKHLKFKFPYSMVEGMWFNVHDLEPVMKKIENKITADFWITPQWNEWNGSRKVQFNVKHAEFTDDRL